VLLRRMPAHLVAGLSITVVLALTTGIIGGYVGVALLQSRSGDERVAVAGAFLLAGSAGSLAAFALVLWRRREFRRRHSVRRSATADRLPRFASDNGFRYDALERQIELPHRIFHLPYRSPRLVGVLRSTTERPFVLGTLLLDRNEGRGVVTHETRPVLAVRLDRMLPNIQLEPTGVAPDPLAIDQRLALEGDFDRWFTLLCPAGAESAALAVLTPDVMAAMIDHAGTWSAEIADDWLLFRPPHESLLHLGAEEMRAIFALLDTVGGQFVEQTDGPVEAEPVARSARRLRVGLRWPAALGLIAIVFVVVFVVGLRLLLLALGG